MTARLKLTPSRLWAYALDHTLLLIAGTVAALVWANLDHASYERVAHALHFGVNDIGMVFFFALATKQIFEAMLPGGSLASRREAAVPLIAAVAGMAVPASAFAMQAALFDRPDIVRGWAVPCATDIAFSYMAARFVFPREHPAIPFLLLLAIADDALGLILLAVVYPTGPLSLMPLVGLMIPAVMIGWWLKQQRVQNFWPYVLVPGGLSWAALYLSRIHPALALVPIVPLMPHAARDLGIFDAREDSLLDTMNRFESWWKTPVQVILFFFGLTNAGVQFSSIGTPTWIVVTSLVIGKPLGILASVRLASSLGLSLTGTLTARDTLVVGTVAGIGFTVALFFATAAFPPGPLLDEIKMGALLSFVAAPVAIALGASLRSGRR